MGDPEDARPKRDRRDDEIASLTAQIAFLDEEIGVMRRRLADSPRQSRLLEEQLRKMQASLDEASRQNEQLAKTLIEERDRTAALQEELDKLTQPPSTFGIFLRARPDGTADVFTEGRKLRVKVSPEIDLAVLRRGQEVMLNGGLTVIGAEDLVREYVQPTASQDELPIQIFVEDADAGPAIEKALRQLLGELGVEEIDESPPVLGSWYKALTARLRRPAVLEAMEETRRAIELQLLDRYQAGIDGVTGDAVAKLITALGNTKSAVVQVGSVLVVKDGETLIVRQLTVREMVHWQRNPGLFKDPAGALAELQHAAETSTPDRELGHGALSDSSKRT
jgi:Proteasomal ATPase OB N-terminal domain